DMILPERLREEHRHDLASYAGEGKERLQGDRYELPALRSDGTEFPSEISITHIPGTDPPLFARFVRDITERKEAEIRLRGAKAEADAAAQAMADSAERFRLLTEVISLQVWTAKPSGELDYANKECLEYFGVRSGADVLGNAWAQFVHPHDLPNAFVHWQDSLATGRGYEVEFRLRRHDGEYRWFIVRAQAMRESEGAIVKWFGTNTDIHDLKRAQSDAERANRAKDAFLAALSHELRTPLTPVLMTASALRLDERLPEDAREQLAMMERNIALEARLIDDLLDLTRIARGQLRLRSELCDAHSLIGLAVEIVRDDALAKGVSLERNLGAQRSGLVVDPARFQQVIWNLLRNAVKFTPPGGRVAIRTVDEADEDGAGRLRIEVVDSGIGIDPAALKKIFLPFEQADPRGDHRFGGMGLGLAIARAIVDLHGGTIAAESAGEGYGATFVVEIPGATEAPHGVGEAPSLFPALAVATEPARTRAEEAQRPLRLLLVEDHSSTLEVLSRLLTRAGHAVVTAGTLADALSAAAAGIFDLVISDLGLPDGTGNELMEILRARYKLRGIALSGFGMEEDVARSRQAGFAAHLTKPVDFQQLRRALHDVTNDDGRG
ncbi:MAG TPA: ATP-binding protein, partial [Chthoniobacterales bacterium]|nr:ATP-binding protein [Chthoniobacterales bacterium]